MIKYNYKENEENLKKYVYRKKNETNSSKYIIITGYTGPDSISNLKDLDYENIEVFIGMYGNRIDQKLDRIIKKIDCEQNIDIYYTKVPVHSKIYSWWNDGQLKEYAIGSANFSANALIQNYYKETLECFEHNVEEFERDFTHYYEIIKNKSIKVRDFIPAEYNPEYEQRAIEVENGELTFLSTKCSNATNIIGQTTGIGDVHAGGGLNWGYSNGMPKLNDCYIPLSADFFRENPDIFDKKNPDCNIPIEVIWDDGEKMTMLLEGNRESNSVTYPKQISSYKNKHLLGDYLRKRIGDKIGIDLLLTEREVEFAKKLKNNYSEDTFIIDRTMFESIKSKFITREMLEKYGRTSIGIKKISEGLYEFDFSTK